MSAGVDLRDLYRPGGGASRLTLRLVLVLLRNLPPDAMTWLLAAQDAEQDEKLAKASRIRERAAHYKRQAREAG